MSTLSQVWLYFKIGVAALLAIAVTTLALLFRSERARRLAADLRAANAERRAQLENERRTATEQERARATQAEIEHDAALVEVERGRDVAREMAKGKRDAIAEAAVYDDDAAVHDIVRDALRRDDE